MVANLVSNVQAAIGNYQVTLHCCWLNSTVALYWINNQGKYQQFVANCVNKIRQHNQVIWHYVPTTNNPADVGSRGGTVMTNELWRKGPSWLSNPSKWPPDKRLEATPEIKAEAKLTKQILAVAISKPDVLDELKKDSRERGIGPIKTSEIKQQQLWWTQRVQKEAKGNPHFQTDQIQLNLQSNDEQVLECRGRIVGEYPIYLPESHPFTAKVVFQAHLSTIHGGIGLTMTKVRELYWVPCLRHLTRKIVKRCYGCKRFHVKAFQVPPSGKLPTTRTKGTTPYQVVGVDFAGPIRHSPKSKKKAKAYLALYACSLTRAVHLDLVKSLTASEFIVSLKRFIARRGRPQLIDSDNAAMFQAAARWIKEVREDEKLNDLMCNLSIEWRFNSSHAPWWGGQFERLIGVFKNVFRKAIGNGTLNWTELEEVLLHIEICINNRPLNYVEDDIELPILTPNSILHITIHLSYVFTISQRKILESEKKALADMQTSYVEQVDSRIHPKPSRATSTDKQERDFLS